MKILNQLLEIFTAKSFIQYKVLLLLYIFTIPLFAQTQKNIIISIAGLSYGENNSYVVDHEFENSMNYYLSVNYQFTNNRDFLNGLEPIIRYSNASFKNDIPYQVNLFSGEIMDLYTVNKSANASFVDFILMVNSGFHGERGGGFHIGFGLGYAWYNIDRHFTDLKTEYLYQNEYLLNDDDIVDIYNQSILLHSLKSEAVWAFQIGFSLPLSKYLGLNSNKLSIGLKLLNIRGLKYTKEYIPSGPHFYYTNTGRGAAKLADMGSGSLILNIGYKLN
ncbi:MAG: hypothetical protein GWP19_08040 [Planctomycetia bacterium]|nr:hypothetical protein [Planctomycetia bacterium]